MLEINPQWDNNVNRSFIWRYDNWDDSYESRRNVTYYNVNIRLVFNLNGGPSNYSATMNTRYYQQGGYQVKQKKSVAKGYVIVWKVAACDQ